MPTLVVVTLCRNAVKIITLKRNGKIHEDQIDEKRFLARSLVAELHNSTILYSRASHPTAAVYTKSH